jgi:hypothetical protein
MLFPFLFKEAPSLNWNGLVAEEDNCKRREEWREEGK